MERREDQGDVMFLFNTSEKLLVLNWLETNCCFLYPKMRHLYLTTLYIDIFYIYIRSRSSLQRQPCFFTVAQTGKTKSFEFLWQLKLPQVLFHVSTSRFHQNWTFNNKTWCLTSESPVDRLDSVENHTAPSLLSPAGCCSSDPVLWDERGLTSELKPEKNSWSLTDCSQSTWIKKHEY